MADLQIETRVVQESLVLDLSGDMDAYSSPRLRERLLLLIDNGKRDLLLNMQGVEYIDSIALGTLVSALRRANEEGGKIRLVGLRDEIKKVFYITGLVRVFDIYSTEAEAFTADRMEQ